MKRALPVLLTAALGLVLLGYAAAQDAPKPPPEKVKPEDLDKLLEYLGSDIPEHKNRAEKLLTIAAKDHFEKLVAALPAQGRRGRELLLDILVNTDVPGRVTLCVDTLCRQDARRRERLSASEAARRVDEKLVLQALKHRLNSSGITNYERVQVYRVLGELTLSEAQAVAEEERDGSEKGSLVEFFAEDALLRSTFAAEFAQPAWARYQRRHKDAPPMELKIIQSSLIELAQPAAIDRTQAEMRLAQMLGNDPRVLLALARSPEPERAAFALSVLKRRPMSGYALATQAVMLDQVITGEQMTALLAVDVAVAGAPPGPADLAILRPVVSGEALARLEAVLEGLTAAGNLAELRAQRSRVEADLVPLLRRFGPANEEVKELMERLEAIGAQLDSLERIWRQGWRREFEADILGLKKRE